MKEIKLRTWILWSVILFFLGLSADYFFWHLLLGHKQNEIIATAELPQNSSDQLIDQEEDVSSFIRESETEASPSGSSSMADNFIETLQTCAPEIASQGIATPEALLEYLQKSVGVQKQSISVENYHITLADGSQRRIHVIASDKAKNSAQRELRYYKLDAEGYPERIQIDKSETLENLLSKGTLSRHELRAKLLLVDESTVELERHDQKVFEFQYRAQGRVLSCRLSHCQCP